LEKGDKGGLKMTKQKPDPKKLKAYARELRKNSTIGEVMVWDKLLKKKAMKGLQFYRQFPMEYYIVDFVCRRAKLAIEIDGPSHRFKKKKDRNKDAYLERKGYSILRFSEYEARAKYEEIGTQIEKWLNENHFNQSS
jgi:very-short-patch-repair endonuclease